MPKIVNNYSKKGLFEPKDSEFWTFTSKAKLRQLRKKAIAKEQASQKEEVEEEEQHYHAESTRSLQEGEEPLERHLDQYHGQQQQGAARQ